MNEYYKNKSLENIVYFCEVDNIWKTEVFKDVSGYEGLYQASDLGRVKSFIDKETILSQFLNERNYLKVVLYKKGERKTFQGHQVVAMAFLGHVPCGYEAVVEHKNHVRFDNRIENLEIITQRKNADQKHLPSTSKYTGVYLRENGRWYSCIYVDGKTKHLGSFDNEEEASEYYENAVKAVQNGTEIIIKRKEYTSRYKFVYWNKQKSKWYPVLKKDGEKICLGYFDDELKAYECLQNTLEIIKNGGEIKRKQKTSKYKGVSFYKSTNKWLSRIYVNGKTKAIGYFQTELEAHEAYEKFKNNLIK